jgi:hypothetical protein
MSALLTGDIIMCGNWKGVPCTKERKGYVLPAGDGCWWVEGIGHLYVGDIEILEIKPSSRCYLLTHNHGISHNGKNYHRDGCIRYVAHHNIDKCVMKYYANLHDEKQRSLLSYVRRSLTNWMIPSVSVANRMRGLYEKGLLTHDYTNKRNATLTDTGWRSFVEWLRAETIALAPG